MGSPQPSPPELSGLSYAQYPYEVQQYIEASLNRGYSLNAALRSFREAGGSVANQTARELARNYLATAEGAAVLTNTPAAFIPSDAAYPLKPNTRGGGYVTYARVIYGTADDGTPLYVPAVATHYQQLSRSQINSLLLENVRNFLDQYDVSATRFRFQYVNTYQRGA